MFDFDGTLASLEIDFSLMREKVLTLALEYLPHLDGIEVRYVLEAMREVRARLAVSSSDGEDFHRRANVIIEDIEMEAASRGRPFPYIRPSLKALAASGFKLAVITRNCGGAVRCMFPDIQDYCPVVLPREAVRRVKPDPGHLLTALDRLQVSPDAALMVGDHPMDIETGKRAGTKTAGVGTGRIDLSEMTAAGADLVFEHVGELADYFLKLKPWTDADR